MRVTHATLGATPQTNDDRIVITDQAVILMDGATAFTPTPVDAGTYVDTLSTAITHHLHQHPAADLRTILGNAITTTVTKLQLTPGHAPSSTVSIARIRNDTLDLLVLGDSPIILGPANGQPQRINDDRIHHIHTPARDAYRNRLNTGHGYDDEHRRLLTELQQQQRTYRNTTNGYWIAEADPTAADHALTQHINLHTLTWIILCTDGGERALPNDITHTAQIAQLDTTALQHLLIQHRHKEATGQVGTLHAKRHDDMTIAVVHPHEDAS